ncbi:Protein of unknown function [Lactobacillus delbrueckii subsp. bulgaricus]|nr:Protein of unknown function [Lactobacillus delbrueckii subsp. bulgaricus]
MLKGWLARCNVGPINADVKA